MGIETLPTDLCIVEPICTVGVQAKRGTVILKKFQVRPAPGSGYEKTIEERNPYAIGGGGLFASPIPLEVRYALAIEHGGATVEVELTYSDLAAVKATMRHTLGIR